MIIITQSTANDMQQAGLNVNIYSDINGTNYLFGLGSEIMVIDDASFAMQNINLEKGVVSNGE